MLKTYPLDTILLYLENKLPPEEVREISAYLIDNKHMLSYVIQLSKIKSYTEAMQNRISFQEIDNAIKSFCSGVVQLLDTKHLAFRGVHDAVCYTYHFASVDLSLINMNNNQWNINITTSDNVRCQIVSDHLEVVLDEHIEDTYQLVVDSKKGYYLFVDRNEEQNVLELLL